MVINNTVKVTSTPMTLKEGIVANNDILSFEEFRSFMYERLNTEVLISLQTRLSQIKGCISRGKYKEAYLRWENLEKVILLNKDYNVSLLFIDNINSTDGKSYDFRYASKEYDVLSERGKLTRIKALAERLYKDDIAEQIGEHLNQFINDIATTNTRWKFIKEVFSSDDAEMKSRAANARWHTKNWTYKNILYGDNPVWQGNAADAFMNHMAHLHIQIMAGKLSDADKPLFTSSVFQEEKDNIWKLLIASKNNTAWYTGGDIIFKYQGQIYNIQLKTGQSGLDKQRRSRIGGRLAVKNLLTLIEELIIEIKSQNIERIIQLMYDELKTSGYVEATNALLSDAVESLIQFDLT